MLIPDVKHQTFHCKNIANERNEIYFKLPSAAIFYAKIQKISVF